ncbi:hypothetical protein [Proteus mirabilis]|uniref:hypothetical protein n=1 Tax=Proteus mirabilis TaxID=584 RepID=UPI0034D62056
MDFSNFKKKLIQNLNECSTALENVVVGRLLTCFHENRELSGYGMNFIPFDGDVELSNREFYEWLEKMSVDFSEMDILNYMFAKGSIEFKPVIRDQLENVPHLSNSEVCHILSELPMCTWTHWDTLEIEEISDTYIDEIFDSGSKSDIVGFRFSSNYNWYVFTKYNVLVKVRCNDNDSIRVESSDPGSILSTFIRRKVDSKGTKNIFVRFPWVKEKTNMFKMQNVAEILDLFENFHGIYDGSMMKNSSVFLVNNQTLIDTIACLVVLNSSKQFSFDRVMKIDTSKTLVEKDPTTNCNPIKAMNEKSIQFAPIFSKIVEKHFPVVAIPDGNHAKKVVDDIIHGIGRSHISALLKYLQEKDPQGNEMYRQRQNIYIYGFIGGHFDSTECSEEVREEVAKQLFEKYNLAFFRKYASSLLKGNKNSTDLIVSHVLKKFKMLGEDAFKYQFPLTASAVEFASKPCTIGKHNAIDSVQLSKSIASKLF